MFDFGKSLINMNSDEQKKMLDNATPGQRNMALEMGIGFNKSKTRQQPKPQKRDAYHDLDRLNTIVEKENEAHDFFGKGLTDWQKNVTGKRSSKDATNLKKQFDDYEHGILSDLPKGGKRHGALSEALPKIKEGFLKQGHQFALGKLNERSKSVLDKGLQRLAKGALGAKDESGVQGHDDAAFDLINKYVLSEAQFDEKDADTMYDKYLSYAGVGLEKARASENEEVPGAKPDFKMEDAEMYVENDTGTMSDAGGEGEKNAVPMSEKATVDWRTLGKMSQKYESGKDGTGTVSSGKGDPGGVSYGTYQMTSKQGDKAGGTVAKLLQWEKFPHKDRFEGKTPGTPEFSEEWKQIAKEDPEGFAKLQHEFIYESHFRPAEQNLNRKLGIKLNEQSSTLNEVVWSASVQYSSKMMGKATKRFQTLSEGLDKSSPEYEEKLIKAIYEQKVETGCKKCSPQQKAGVVKRVESELNEALKRLNEGRQTK